MYMWTRLFSREEKESISTFPKNCRAHLFSMWWLMTKTGGASVQLGRLVMPLDLSACFLEFFSYYFPERIFQTFIMLLNMFS